MPVNKHKHMLPDGSIATRNSQHNVYAFVTVARWRDADGVTRYGVLSWHMRHPGRPRMQYASADMTGSVEPVNGGSREGSREVDCETPCNDMNDAFGKHFPRA